MHIQIKCSRIAVKTLLWTTDACGRSITTTTVITFTIGFRYLCSGLLIDTICLWIPAYRANSNPIHVFLLTNTADSKMILDSVLVLYLSIILFLRCDIYKTGGSVFCGFWILSGNQVYVPHDFLYTEGKYKSFKYRPTWWWRNVTESKTNCSALPVVDIY